MGQGLGAVAILVGLLSIWLGLEGALMAVGVAFASIVIAVVWFSVSSNSNLESVTSSLVEKHIDVLARKRRSYMSVDEYGLVDGARWRAEMRNFLRKTGQNRFDGWSDINLDHWALKHIEPRVRDAQQSEDGRLAVDAYDQSMSPTDYEHFCAARLKAAGWETLVTTPGGDQGADIIARRDGVVLVVQCKQYTKAVGNSAVQEAVAAKGHYRGTHAAVVATNGFTRSAQSLASSNNVLLLHHDDLSTAATAFAPAA